jgi:hypothetical protein
LVTVGGMRWAWTHRYAVPMFVSSVVAVLLTGAGLIAVMVYDNGSGGGPPGTAECVAGHWQVREYTESGPLGSAEMVEGVPTFVFNDDGTGVAEFGPDVRMTIQVPLVGSVGAGVVGQIAYRYQVSGETLEFVEQDSNAQLSSEIEVPYEDVLTLPEGPLDYTCSGDEMTITDGEHTYAYQRVG